MILAPIVGRLLPRVDARLIATLAFYGFAGVFFMRVNFLTTIDRFHLIVPTLLQGIPTTMWFVPLTAIILSGLPPERIAAAAGLSNFVRIFCAAAGTSISATVWNDRTILHHVQVHDVQIFWLADMTDAEVWAAIDK
ncbi:protein of unknown function (plasmid) [Caballeronia sp. S22]